MGDAATWAGVAVAIVLGVLGLVDAKRSRRLAKRADKEAKAANRLAADAVLKAAEANHIAERANQLSEDANAIVKRSAAQQEEDWYVDWASEWDMESNVLTLTNRGRDDAVEPSVVITGDELHRVYWSEDDVPAGDKLTFTFDEFTQQRLDEFIRWEQRLADGFLGNMRQVDVRVVIRWRSALGVPSEQILELKLS